MYILGLARQVIEDFNNVEGVPFQRVTEREASIAAFFSRCRLSETGCWLWTGKTTGGGYGSAGRDNLAHRLSYRLFKGEIPKGLWILHSCDTPACCNPGHLRAGTPKDNVADCIARDRLNRPKGSRNGLAKLTEKDIVAIRNSTLSIKALSRKYGIDRTNVHYILNGTTWAHVPMPERPVERTNERAKLTRDQVRAIRAADASISLGELASQYGVGVPLISMIRNGRIWKSVAASSEENLDAR